MAKITLDTITSAYASTSLFQSNFSAIATELNDKVLYRVNPTGEANQMENNLDMNSNDILNVNDINTTSLTVDGTAITPNTNDQTLTYMDTEFTTQAGQDTFLAAYTVGFVDVYYNGVLMATADYTATNGTSVVLASPVVDNADVITIRAFSAFSAGDGITQTVADARYLLEANNLSDLNSASTSRTNLGLGTAATADVQTSSTDTTADALMAVGAFGHGNNQNQFIGSGLDPDDYITTGVFYAGFTSPTTSTAFLVVDGSSGSRVRQTWYDSVSSAAETRYLNGTWSTWQPVYTGANYQPEDNIGLGVVVRLRNGSGGTIAADATTAGSNLSYVRTSTAGAATAIKTATGTYKNVAGGNILDTFLGEFVRIA